MPTRNTTAAAASDGEIVALFERLALEAGRLVMDVYASEITFDEKADLLFNRRESLPLHSNGMRFRAWDAAGNLLGEEQSGQVREVGFELYQEMLQEAIAKLKSGEIEMSDEGGEWSPQINLGVPVLIPESFVPDLDVRLGLYRRLSQLSTKVELEGFAAELIDRFGELPKEVNTLLLVVRIKAMCKRAGISKLDAGPKGVTVQFHNDKFANPAGLVEFIHAEKGAAKVKDNKIILTRAWTTEADRIKGAYTVARDLAEKLLDAKKAARKTA